MSQIVQDQTRAAIFSDRNFRWLFGGGLISMLGDQFTLIALPWLVLKLTGDPLALGTVLAIMGLPRAIFILIGGALVDQYSPKLVLMLTKHVNTGLLSILCILIFTGTLQLWMVYLLALAIGLTTAFSLPAGSSILPQTLPPEFIHAANGILISMRQLVVLVGPLLASTLIVVFDGDRHSGLADAKGLGLAIGFDAVSFAFSAWTLAQVRPTSSPVQNAHRSVFQAINEALCAFWKDKALRTLCLYFAAIAFLVGGPIQVALPVLASTRLEGGVASLGLLLAGHGGGALLGMAISGMRPNWRLRTLGTTILVIDGLAGLIFLSFGHITSVWQGVALLALIGALSGFVQVAIFSWIQRQIPPAMLGRAISLFVFIFMGLAPLGAAAAGAALRALSPASLFAVCGLVLLAFAALGATLTPIREIRD